MELQWFLPSDSWLSKFSFKVCPPTEALQKLEKIEMRGNTKGKGKKCYVDIQISELSPMLLAGGITNTTKL